MCFDVVNLHRPTKLHLLKLRLQVFGRVDGRLDFAQHHVALAALRELVALHLRNSKLSRVLQLSAFVWGLGAAKVAGGTNTTAEIAALAADTTATTAATAADMTAETAAQHAQNVRDIARALAVATRAESDAVAAATHADGNSAEPTTAEIEAAAVRAADVADAVVTAASAADDTDVAALSASEAALAWRQSVVYKLWRARTAAVLAVKTAAQGASDVADTAITGVSTADVAAALVAQTAVTSAQFIADTEAVAEAYTASVDAAAEAISANAVETAAAIAMTSTQNLATRVIAINYKSGDKEMIPLSNIKLNQKTDRHLIEIDARTVVRALGLYDDPGMDGDWSYFAEDIQELPTFLKYRGTEQTFGELNMLELH